jgi:predicted nicotinamide N-methyase
VPTPSPADLRAFVRRHTRLAPVPDIPGLRLHVADDVARVGRAVTAELGLPDADLPYWAFAWAGGLAVARYLVEHPTEVAGLRVVDVGSGSGLCAIAAVRAGAGAVRAFDIDPLAEAAIAVNARANDVRVGFGRRDPLDESPPPCDVILAGDVCYQETMAARMLAWLRLAADGGTRILLGDPGRPYLPVDLERLATYRVRTSLELEDAEVKEAAVYTFSSGPGTSV